MKNIGLYIVLLILVQKSFAQTNKEEDKNVKILSAGSIEYEKKGDVEYRYLKSSKKKKRVILQRGNTTFICNTAVQNQNNNTVHAYGNIIIKDEEGNTLNGDTFDYNNNTGIVIVRGDTVVLHDDKTTLTTKEVFYDVVTKDARYESGGIVETDSTVLTSEKGYLWHAIKTIAFKGDVVLEDTIGQQHLETDTLTYDTRTRIAEIYTTTHVTTAKEKIITQGGNYNTRTQVVRLSGNSIVDNEDFVMSALDFYYDKQSGYSVAKKNVKLYSKKDSVTIYGDEMVYEGENYSDTKVYGSALMEKPFGDDTLFLAADTLISINDSIASEKKTVGYYNVEIYSKKLQGKCDSLIYNFSDSMIYFFKDPILWNKGSQLTSEKMHAVMKGNEIDTMHMDTDAFIISKDTLGNYNQIKGRIVDAHFEDSEISEVDVDGNGQSIYFAIEGDTLLMGMNKVDCSKMIMRFKKQNVLKNITFIKDPESHFIPRQLLSEPDKRLPGFKKRFDEKPILDELKKRINTSTLSLDAKKMMLTNTNLVRNKQLNNKKINPKKIIKNTKE